MPIHHASVTYKPRWYDGLLFVAFIPIAILLLVAWGILEVVKPRKAGR